MAEKCFNSIKVRLEQWANMIVNTLMTFQFHKGTIRTSHIASHVEVGLGFNSIKVRLELSVERRI